MMKLFQLPLWAWVSFLLSVSTLVHGLGPSSADPPPRAALVTFADESDLPNLLLSIRQVEDRFNSRYHYNWVIFSTHELSDTFKSKTSNATHATCIYEVIPDENWSVPGWVDDQNKNLMDLRCRYRWNSGIFAREKRLRDYDWFWKIEPGAQMTHDMQFDVFRFMRDKNIALFHRDVAESSRRALSPGVKAFIDKYPELLHEEADLSWLLDGTPFKATADLATEIPSAHGNSDRLSDI